MVASQHKMLKGVPEYTVYQDSLYLPSPQYVKKASLGYDMVFADLLWLRAIQAFGGHFASDKNYELLYNMFDVITELDPHFIDVYRFGSLAVGEEARKYELGLKILEKGMVNNPGKYRLPFEAGYISWWDMKDAERAKKYYIMASKCPDAPDWIERQLAYFDLQLGKYNAAFERWVEAFLKAADSNQGYLKEISLNSLKNVINDWNIKILQDAADTYKKNNNQSAADLKILVKEGCIKKYKIASFPKFLQVIDTYYEKYDRNINNLNNIINESTIEDSGIPVSPSGGYYILVPTENVIVKSEDLFNYYKDLLLRIRNTIEIYKKEHKKFPLTLYDLGPIMQNIKEPMGGEWLYNPATGEIKSSVFRQF